MPETRAYENRPPAPECTPDTVVAWLSERAEALEKLKSKKDRFNPEGRQPGQEAKVLRSAIDAFRHHFGYDG